MQSRSSSARLIVSPGTVILQHQIFTSEDDQLSFFLEELFEKQYMGLRNYPQETLAFTTMFNTLHEMNNRSSIDSLHLFHDVRTTRTEILSSVFGSILLYLKAEAKVVYL